MWNASEIKGYTVVASDGDIGTVSDLLFDDQSWRIDWLVVDTSTWFTERMVLLPTSALGHADLETETFSVKLTRQEVKDSPDSDTHRPASRQSDDDVYGPYWGGALFVGGYGSGMAAPVVAPMAIAPTPGAPTPDTERVEQEAAEAQRRNDDPHLRSINTVEGYYIQATDGDIGHVEDMLVDESDWSIRYLVIDTRNWWPGKKVLISPRSAHDISWANKTVYLRVDREKVKNSPEYDASTIVDRDYEDRFLAYYNDSDPRFRRNG